MGIPSEKQRVQNSNQCIQEAAIEGLKASIVTSIFTAVPTLLAVRMVPWAKTNINYTGQALIISGAAIAAFFITADKTILDCARRNTQYEKTT